MEREVREGGLPGFSHLASFRFVGGMMGREHFVVIVSARSYENYVLRCLHASQSFRLPY